MLLRQAGVYSDPFEEAERQQRMQQQGDGNGGAGGVQVHPALQAPTAAQPHTAPAASAFGGPSTAVSPAASPGMRHVTTRSVYYLCHAGGALGAPGLFGQAAQQPAGGFALPAAAAPASTLARSGSRVRAKTGRK